MQLIISFTSICGPFTSIPGRVSVNFLCVFQLVITFSVRVSFILFFLPRPTLSFLFVFFLPVPSSTFGVPLVASSSCVRSQCLLLKKASFSLAGSHRRDALCTLQLFLQEVQLLFIAAPLHSLLLAGCHRSWSRAFHFDLLLGKNHPRLSR